MHQWSHVRCSRELLQVRDVAAASRFIAGRAERVAWPPANCACLCDVMRLYSSPCIREGVTARLLPPGVRQGANLRFETRFGVLRGGGLSGLDELVER